MPVSYASSDALVTTVAALERGGSEVLQVEPCGDDRWLVLSRPRPYPARVLVEQPDTAGGAAREVRA